MRGFLAYMWAHPGKQLLFMGQEFGQLSEWSESRSLDWWLLDQPSHRRLQEFVGALNRTYAATPALWRRDADPDAFAHLGAPQWDPDVLAFSRRDGDATLVAVCNFSGAALDGYELDLPHGGRWREVLNTDAAEYGGSGVGNLGEVTADPAGRAVMVLPALAVLWLAD
jgi:1,4-alpha-glucan branching enzyme